MEQETVLGEGFVRLLYETTYGRLLGGMIFRRRSFSKLYGIFQNQSSSRRKIAKVAESLGIDLEEAELPPESFPHFNAFFARTLKKEARPVDPDPAKLISPCDARLLVFPGIDRGRAIEVKGGAFDLEKLLDSEELASRFSGGDLFIYRLCPADYHRFHFPEDCRPGFTEVIDGPLHSVNPIALASKIPILDTNLRHLTLMDTEGPKGTVAMIEVGAMCVGSIVQTYVPQVPAKRGDEKGMFLFGGSTVIVIYEPGIVSIDEDLMEHSRDHIETLVKLGMTLGKFRS